MKRIIIFICGLITMASPVVAADYAGTATGVELDYVHGVTSAIQTQLNGKLGTSGTAANSSQLEGHAASYFQTALTNPVVQANLGTGVYTVLGTNVGSAGAPVVNGGALGTPSSGTLTNCTFPTLNQNTTGTATNATNAVNVGTVTKSDNVDYYLTFTPANSTANQVLSTGPAKYNPYNNILTVAGLNMAQGATGGTITLSQATGGSNYRSISVPNTLTASLGFMLPDALPSGGQVLSWATPSGSPSVTQGSFITPVQAGAMGTGVISALGNAANGAGGFTTTDGTKTLTNTTYDVSATGNVFKQTKQLIFSHPDRCDGTGATMDTTGTDDTFGHCSFSASAAYTANTAYYEATVPADIDTSVDLTAEWHFSLGGADTNAQCYKIEMADVADSAARAGSYTNTVNLPKAGDGTGASGDAETVAATTLTSWRSNLTAGHLLRIRVGRDGVNEGAGCTSGAGSTVTSYSGPLVINYGSIQ